MFSTLSDWLAHLERSHPVTIELGLERVSRVKDQLAIPQTVPVILVGGTNGKGSTCAMLESIFKAAGYRTGLYTSPHLLRYNERVRVGSVEASDDMLVAGFEAVEVARVAAGVSLSYFEFGTLAAWWVFAQAQVDVVILEVGLGGRLDAVNIFEPDCSIVTSVALDHMDWLGDTREKIGFEKAGIFRAHKPAVCADPMPPQSLLDHAAQIGADLCVSGRDFGFTGDRQQWAWWHRSGTKRGGLAFPALRGTNQLLNAAAVMAALESLRDLVPVSMQAIREGLMLVELAGRFQVLPGQPLVILDVAHNPQAVGVLNENLSSQGFYPETWAVLGMLGDKDIAGVIARLAERIDHWLVASLPGERGVASAVLAAQLQVAGVKGSIQEFAAPAAAFAYAKQHAAEADRIVIFGSFLTVADVMPHVRES